MYNIFELVSSKNVKNPTNDEKTLSRRYLTRAQPNRKPQDICIFWPQSNLYNEIVFESTENKLIMTASVIENQKRVLKIAYGTKHTNYCIAEQYSEHSIAILW